MKTIGNEPAHPIKDVGVNITDGGKEANVSFDPHRYDIQANFYGLTKREMFAAMAMQGLVSNCYYGTGISIDLHAQEAVNLADALIEELNKEK